MDGALQIAVSLLAACQQDACTWIHHPETPAGYGGWWHPMKLHASGSTQRCPGKPESAWASPGLESSSASRTLPGRVRMVRTPWSSFGNDLAVIQGDHMSTSQTRTPIGTHAKTGQRCPESGIWKVVGTPTTTAPIAKHNVMPPYKDKAVTWELVQYA